MKSAHSLRSPHRDLKEQEMSRYNREFLAAAALAFAGVFAASLLAAPQSAQATVVFMNGNNPQPGEENILFGIPQTGTTIIGLTNQSQIGVQFVSTQTLETGGLGQA